jgi:predicted ATPase
VLRQTANTLDVIEQPDRPLEDVLAEMLAGKRMLLLLDNAEHLLPDAAGAIATLRDLDGPKLVVTSRERLQLAGEHVYPVPQLTALEGLDLFSARAAAIDPAFQATAATAELCARLDNLPLAIELAAARTAVLRPEQILERLGSRLDLLKGGRDADPRQQTLRATIAWSYDLLSGEERALFARFAVFAGAATLEAVEDVCSADLETLASLVDKSLVRRDGARYWMLETIREYGRDQLDDVAENDVIDRHGGFYEAFGRSAEHGLRGRDAAEWLDRVEQDLPNLRAAMARGLERGLAERCAVIAGGLGRYWEARSSATEGRSWIERSRSAGAVHVRAYFWAARLAFFQGDLTAAAELFVDAAAAANASGETATEAACLAYCSWAARERGEPSAGRPELDRSRTLLAAISDPWERSEILLPLTGAESGDAAGLQALAQEVLELKRIAGDVIAISDSLNNLGWEGLLVGDYDRAITSLEEALSIARELDDTFRITLASCNLGLAAVLQERYADAAQLLRETLELCIRRGDQRCGAEAILGLAAAAAGLGQNELAVRLDAVRQALMDEAGIVYVPTLTERLDRLLQPARDLVGEVAPEVATLELALDQSTSIASPNE